MERCINISIMKQHKKSLLVETVDYKQDGCFLKVVKNPIHQQVPDGLGQ